MSCETPTMLWRLAFDRHGNVVANGKHPVGRTTKILETGMWFASMMWDGEAYEAHAKCKEHLLSELRAAAGLVPKEAPAGVATH